MGPISLKPKENKGFTLIELSIVLVIIGLIVGGVLMGRDLIEAAGNRQTISFQQEFATKWNTFKLKYNCVPGDCVTAEEMFGTVVSGTCPSYARRAEGSCNGNGDKKISWSSPVFEGSQGLQFDHLYEAGLFDNYTNEDRSISYYSRTPLGSDADMFVGSNQVQFSALYNQATLFGGVNAIQYGRQQNFGGSQPKAAIISPQRLFQIDTKMDDGKPGGGHIRAWHGEIFGQSPSTEYTTCITNASGQYEYIPDNMEVVCRFQYKLD